MRIPLAYWLGGMATSITATLGLLTPLRDVAAMGAGNQCRAAVGGRDAVVVEHHDEGCTDITFSMGEPRRR
jgi:hypothetical protein